MRFWLLGLAVVLAAHVGAATVASVLAVGWHRLVQSRLAALAPAVRARRLLALALAPSAAGVATAGLAALAWLAFEPRSTAETPGPVLVTLALLGLGLAALSVVSVAREVIRTRRVVESFLCEGRELGGLPLPATRAAHAFPVAALAGVWRPRLLLAEQVLAALGPDELDAVVAHELAHLDARDNLKRLVLAAFPDPLAFTGRGPRLREAFREAAEAAADARACARVPPTVLARAIVKVAGLVPAGGRFDVAAASFHHEGSLASRVRTLLNGPQGPPQEVPSRPRLGARGLAIRVALVMALAVALAGSSAALATLHGALERLVHLLA